MSNNSNPNYFRLGVFVLAAIGVLLAVILIFGSGQIFKKSFMVETYIKQSVTGLDAGAAVRFRGVKIGQVTTIGLSGDIYERDVPFHERRQYVVVRMQIFGEKVKPDQIEEFVKNHLPNTVCPVAYWYCQPCIPRSRRHHLYCKSNNPYLIY